MYRISANSFRGKYSFLNLALFTVTLDLYFINLNSCRGNYSKEETIQGQKLFAEIQYSAFTMNQGYNLLGDGIWGWVSQIHWKKQTQMSLTFFMNVVSDMQPPSSETPLIGTYFSCIMIMVASSVVCIKYINFYHFSIKWKILRAFIIEKVHLLTTGT